MDLQLSHFISVDEVLGFINRTLNRGVPVRVALVRAERRYGVDRRLLRAFLSGNDRG